MGDISSHFSHSEFACNCGCGFGLKTGDVKPALIEFLEQLRDIFGQPITINSGCRCATHNAAVGGASDSRHVHGDAADIVVEDISPSIVYSRASKLIGDRGGCGSYATWTHVDLRGTRARWRG